MMKQPLDLLNLSNFQILKYHKLNFNYPPLPLENYISKIEQYSQIKFNWETGNIERKISGITTR